MPGFVWKSTSAWQRLPISSVQYPNSSIKSLHPMVKILEKKLLSDNWYKLFRYTFEFKTKKGNTDIQHREVYDRGNGSVILLYNKEKGTVILTRQFRLPTYVNGNADGLMIEACAGLLDQDNPEDCIRRETE